MNETDGRKTKGGEGVGRVRDGEKGEGRRERREVNQVWRREKQRRDTGGGLEWEGGRTRSETNGIRGDDRLKEPGEGVIMKAAGRGKGEYAGEVLCSQGALGMIKNNKGDLEGTVTRCGEKGRDWRVKMWMEKLSEKRKDKMKKRRY